MIIDITGIELVPGNCGNDCWGNGNHYNENGEPIECCCDECDYMMCCMENYDYSLCKDCCNLDCPNRICK